MPLLSGGSHKFILASASPRRREILSQLGVRFLVDPSSAVECEREPREAPTAYALRLALLKAQDVRGKHRTGIVIGADTVVAVQNLILGKPRSRQEARAMLRHLQGRWHRVITAVCLADVETGTVRSGSSCSRVHFRRLANEEIEWYLRTGEYRDKAGAYAIQGYGSLLIDRLEGCYFNVVGFPVVTFLRLCRRMGIRLIP